MKLIIVTGLSGSGKSVAIRQLEDSGYYCIDNLPLSFILPVAKYLQQSQEYVAFAVDARSDFEGYAPEKLIEELNAQKDWDVRVLFLTASTQELIQRFSETRRRHPLTLRFSLGKEKVTLAEVITKERELLEPYSVQAHVIDTTHLQSNTLRTWVKEFADAPHADLSLTFESFGYKHGIPIAADLVFDVRNLPNPYYDTQLRPLTGQDQAIIEFMQNQPMVCDMVKDITRFIEKWLPSYQATNRHYLTIAIGCTGGQHRSVYVAETLAKYFAQKMDSVAIRHRIIGQAKKPVKGLSQTL
ncbi:MAG TPA: RNase adapter RapZ [Candidatus Aphodousia faecigallinarum]|uniref:RNase adapter RapZ n=1 Tax=Candidatus Aphodousia faecigallinarum TaxID=2840677 RepID=A0A9D1LGL0_9BURK|nr:RNase adapter RapZ [Candidatus Aphodousia faecigallinarum]